jgi:hypothetical protein
MRRLHELPVQRLRLQLFCQLFHGYCDLCPSTYGYNYPNPYHAGTAPEWRARVPTGMRETRMCGALPYVRVVDGSGLHHVPDFITERIVRCRSV